jgi:hypothetical protein
MKRNLICFSVIIALNPMVYAQKSLVGAANVAQGGVFAGGIANQSGVYDLTKSTLDRTEVIKLLATMQSEDAEYLKGEIKSLDEAMAAFIRKSRNEGLAKLADESLNRPVSLSAFLSAKRDYVEAADLLEAKIQAITTLPSLKNGGHAVVMQNDKMMVDGRLKADFSPLKKSYLDYIAKNRAEVNNHEVSIADKRVQPLGYITQKVGDPIHADLKNVYTQDDINAMRNQAALEMAIKPEQKKMIDAINAHTLRVIKTLIASHGSSEKYRIATDDQGLQDGLKRLEAIFFARSFLRYRFGSPIGAIGINYTKKTFNLDYFTAENQVEFLNMSLWNEADKIAVANYITESLRTQKGRSATVFGGEFKLDIKDILSRVSTAINTLKGQYAWSFVNGAVLELLKADIVEDLMMDQPDGLLQLRDNFRKRYLSTSDNKGYYSTLAVTYMGMITGKMPKAGAAGGAYQMPTFTSTDNTNGMVRIAAEGMIQAANLRRQGMLKLEMATVLSKSADEDKNAAERMKDVFGSDKGF